MAPYNTTIVWLRKGWLAIHISIAYVQHVVHLAHMQYVLPMWRCAQRGKVHATKKASCILFKSLFLSFLFFPPQSFILWILHHHHIAILLEHHRHYFHVEDHLPRPNVIIHRNITIINKALLVPVVYPAKKAVTMPVLVTQADWPAWLATHQLKYHRYARHLPHLQPLRTINNSTLMTPSNWLKINLISLTA